MDPYEQLPDDEHEAFLQLEREFRDELESRQEDQNSNWTYVTADYMNKVQAAAMALEIEALSDFSVDTRDIGSHNANFDDFLRAVDSVIIQMRIDISRRQNAMIVGLTEAQKTKIHHFIEKIREEVEISAAPAPKKERLFDLIARLAEEVSKDRTRYDRFADLARSLAGLSRDLERDGARPWLKWFEKIMGLISDAKEAEPQLPKPAKRKKIEPPRKELPGPTGSDESNWGLDDEIPF